VEDHPLILSCNVFLCLKIYLAVDIAKISYLFVCFVVVTAVVVIVVVVVIAVVVVIVGCVVGCVVIVVVVVVVVVIVVGVVVVVTFSSVSVGASTEGLRGLCCIDLGRGPLSLERLEDDDD